jgi:hypothetical protein
MAGWTTTATAVVAVGGGVVAVGGGVVAVGCAVAVGDGSDCSVAGGAGGAVQPAARVIRINKDNRITFRVFTENPPINPIFVDFRSNDL